MKKTLRTAVLSLCAGTFLVASGCVHLHDRHPHGMPPGQVKKIGHTHVQPHAVHPHAAKPHGAKPKR